MTDFTPMKKYLLGLAFLAGVLAAKADRIVLVAGGMEERVGVAAPQARLYEPFGAEFDGAGNLYIIEMAAGNRLLRVDGRGMLAHVAGSRSAGDGGDGGPALEAKFNGPHNLAVLPDGNVLIGDTWNGRVRHVDMAKGVVHSLPGFGVARDKARASGPYCITLTPDGGTLLVADLRRVHAIDLKTAQSRVLAGNGEKGIPDDGALAIEAPLVDPRAAVQNRKGNLYILERNGHALRVVDRAGKIRTVVNVSGKKGASGDGGDAREALMNGPKHLCIDLGDNVIIADAENNVVRKYEPATGRIVRVAGTGKKGSAGLGAAPEQCELARPHGVTVHRDGTLYITDSYNDRILKIVK